MSRLRDVAWLFLRLGATSFGGPAVHIAMMEDEFVHRRRWLTREHFLDLAGATNLIPGPNSTEMAIHIGFLRAGWVGLVAAGLCFIVPAALITIGFAWAYVKYGSLPEAAPFLLGVQPVVLAIILIATWRLGRTAVKSWQGLIIGFGVAAASLLGFNEIAAFFAGGIGGAFWLLLSDPKGRSRLKQGTAAIIAWAASQGKCWAAVSSGAALALGGVSVISPVPLEKLGLFFLKIGCVLYGSGYVLVTFLESGLVRGYGWLTQKQLMDAVAIGQLTPGPLFSTATCVGYILAGMKGAVLATFAIFLPSFVFVAVLNPIVPRLRQFRWTAAFLDAVNVSAVALMGVVLVHLARTALADWRSWLIALGAVVAGLRWKVNTAWLILCGGFAGLILSRVAVP